MSETLDRAAWDGPRLKYTTDYDWPTPHTKTHEFARVEPTRDESFCYWCAIGGQCFALEPVGQDSCIATVQSALMASDLERNKGGWINSDTCYVIWRPKDHSKGAWDRWQKKWSKRTSLKTT